MLFVEPRPVPHALNHPKSCNSAVPASKRLPRLISLALLTALYVSSQTPSKEYIRLNGQIIAIENQTSTTNTTPSPSSEDFGNQPFLTAGSPRQITLTNNGTTTTSITSVQLTGTGAGEFSASGCTGTLAAGGACPITVTFSPSGPGTFSCNVLITYGPGSTLAVPLQGTGVAGSTSTLFFDGFNLGPPINNFTGWAGVSFTVGVVPVTVTAVGRIYAQGNTNAHTVKLVDASTNLDVGSAVVTPSVGGSVNSITYVSLATPVTLNALGTYYLQSSEDGSDSIYFSNVLGTAASVFINSGQWTYGSGGSGSGDYGPVGMVTQPVTVTSTPLDTGLQLGVVSYLTGWEGVAFTVGSSPVTVNSLGRIYAPGNTQSHEVKLLNAATGATVADVTVTPSTGVVGKITYAPLSSAITLPAGGSYYLVSHEVQDSDSWYDDSPVFGDSTGLSITSGVSSPDPGTSLTTFTNFGGPSHSYGPVSLLTGASPGSGPALIAQYNSLRNDINGWIGASFTVGSSGAMVGALGRIFVQGSTQQHIVKLINASNGQDVQGAAVTIAATGAVPGLVKYALLPSPVALNPGSTYYVVSQETSGGDQWYEQATGAGGLLPQATVNGGGYFSSTNPTTWVPQGSTSIYGPVSLIFTSGSSPAPIPSGFTTYLGPYGSGTPQLSGASTTIPIRAYSPLGASQITFLITMLNDPETQATDYTVIVEGDHAGNYIMFLENSQGTAPAWPYPSLNTSGATTTLATPITLGTMQITAYRFSPAGNEMQLDLTVNRTDSFNDQIVVWSQIDGPAYQYPLYSSPWMTVVGSWASGAPAAPGVTLNRPDVNFGNEEIDSPTTQTLIITNSGNAPLTISGLQITGADAADFSVSNNGCTASVAPDYTCTITLAFDPESFGPRTASLTIFANDPNSPHTLALSGTGYSAPPATFTAYLGAYGTGFQSFSGSSTVIPFRVSIPSGASQLNIMQIVFRSADYDETEFVIYAQSDGAGNYTLHLTDEVNLAPWPYLTMTANGTTITAPSPITIGSMQITAYRLALVNNEFQLDLSLTRTGAFNDQIIINGIIGNNQQYSTPWYAVNGQWSNQ